MYTSYKRDRYHNSKNFKRKANHQEDTDDESDAEADDNLVWQDGRDVFFHASVSKRTILTLICKMRLAEREALLQGRNLRLFIHSEGGDAHAGLSGMNHIENMRVPVTTIADGLVASASTFLLLAGTHRYGMQHCSVLIHQLSTAFWGKHAELVDEMENSHALMRTIKRLYTEKTCMEKKDVAEILLKEKTMSCKQCVEFGILHNIYDSTTRSL